MLVAKISVTVLKSYDTNIADIQWFNTKVLQALGDERKKA